MIQSWGGAHATALENGKLLISDDGRRIRAMNQKGESRHLVFNCAIAGNRTVNLKNDCHFKFTFRAKRGFPPKFQLQKKRGTKKMVGRGLLPLALALACLAQVASPLKRHRVRVKRRASSSPTPVAIADTPIALEASVRRFGKKETVIDDKLKSSPPGIWFSLSLPPFLTCSPFVSCYCAWW